MSLKERAQGTVDAARRLFVRRRRIADYQRTFDTPHGRRVLLHLMQVNGILERSPGRADPNVSLVKDGRRMAVLGILSHLRLDANAVINQHLEGGDEILLDTDARVDIG